ncbi:hypothetical protein M5689_021634 [Euphorbia peplus]|nr:hypothetical protein M5689_021634 [Euphorbia peplus]
MGGSESKIQEDEQVISIYKHRVQFMKEAVSSRRAFASAHSAYAMSLKNNGAALNDFVHQKFSCNPSSVPVATSLVMDEKKVELPVPFPALKKIDKKVRRMARKPVTLMDIFADLDDHFLEASQSTREVSTMLEAIKLQFNPIPFDHFNRVVHAITWNRSLREMPSLDDFYSEENKTLATVLDEMLAWEKKLYDEVKAGEITKYECQKKVALLTKQKKKEINCLRDEHLYPKLVEFVDGLAKMWETMRYHHGTQPKVADALKPLDDLKLPGEIKYQYDPTIMLYTVVRHWHSDFCKLIDYQKDYVRALCNWLKLNVIPTEKNLEEKVSSPPRVMNLPIEELFLAWNDDLDKLPDELARSAMSNFAAVIQTIMYKQEEEMKMRKKSEAIGKEFNLKSRQYQDWCIENGVSEEREAVLISLEEDGKACLKFCKQSREKSLASLKRCLPELFRAMSEFAQACSVMYSNLRSIAENQ